MKKKISRQRQWQLKMRLQGRCTGCGVICKPYARCEYHREKDRIRDKARYERRKKTPS